MTLIHRSSNGELLISISKKTNLPKNVKQHPWCVDVDFACCTRTPSITLWNLLNAICYRYYGKIEYPAYAKEGSFQFFYFKSERAASWACDSFIKCIKLLEEAGLGFIFYSKTHFKFSHELDPYWRILEESLKRN